MSAGRWKNARSKRIKIARKKARAIKREKRNRMKIAQQKLWTAKAAKNDHPAASGRDL